MKWIKLSCVFLALMLIALINVGCTFTPPRNGQEITPPATPTGGSESTGPEGTTMQSTTTAPTPAPVIPLE